jgi:hypothetical protein
MTKPLIYGAAQVCRNNPRTVNQAAPYLLVVMGVTYGSNRRVTDWLLIGGPTVAASEPGSWVRSL